MCVFGVRQFVGQAEFVHVVCRDVIAVGGIFRQTVVVDFHAELIVYTHKDPHV